jgi:hypothetical protein
MHPLTLTHTHKAHKVTHAAHAAKQGAVAAAKGVGNGEVAPIEPGEGKSDFVQLLWPAIRDCIERGLAYELSQAQYQAFLAAKQACAAGTDNSVLLNGLFVRCVYCREPKKLKRDRINGWEGFVTNHFQECKAKRKQLYSRPSEGPFAEFLTKQPKPASASASPNPAAPAVSKPKPAKQALPRPQQTKLREPHMPKHRGHLQFSQWDFTSATDDRNGHLSCVFISTQLCVAAEIAGGLCDQAVKALFQRGVDMASTFLGAEEDKEVLVEDVLKAADLPVPQQFHGPMLLKARYEAKGVSVGDQRSLSQTLIEQSAQRQCWEMTDDRQRTHVIIVTPGATPTFFWLDPHPCTAVGQVAQHDKGKAMWLSFVGGELDDWLEHIRYPDPRLVQYSLCAVNVSDRDCPVAKKIPPCCGRCGLCFVLPASVRPQVRFSHS